MDLLDRYLQAVRKHLPFERQDDIVAELRANLEAQLEEKEAALSRPLTQAEAEAWIKQLGSPLQMAAHYQPQQYLIGPSIFPIYRHVLKLALSWAAIIYAIGTVVKFVAGAQPDGVALLEAILRVPLVVLYTAAWCTLVFAAIEYAVTHGCIKLPQVEHLSTLWAPGVLPSIDQQTPGKKPRSFAQAVTEVVFGFFLVDWLLLIPHHPWLLMGPGAVILDISPYQLAPVWWQFYWCIVALNIVQVGWNLESLLRGKWRRPQPLKPILFKALSVFSCLILLNARDHALLAVKQSALDQAHSGPSIDVINLYVYRGFMIITAIAVLQLAWDLGRMSLNAYRKRAAVMQ
jgi:hypothetical protein